MQQAVSPTQDLKDELSKVVSQKLEFLAQALTSGDLDPLRRYLEVLSHFHGYSVHNRFLILAQRPMATHVAGMKRWNQLGRRVKKGERGLRILAPILRKEEEISQAGETTAELLVGFRPTYVFDLAQTEGEPLPGPLPSFIERWRGRSADLPWIAWWSAVPTRFGLNPSRLTSAGVPRAG